MREIICDRCGKHQPERPPHMNMVFPAVNLTIANSLLESVTPPRIDLCEDCVRDLLFFLGRKEEKE